MFVKRNQSSEVIAISKVAEGDISESIADDAPEILQFLQSEKSVEQLALEQTDQAMARVVRTFFALNQ